MRNELICVCDWIEHFSQTTYYNNGDFEVTCNNLLSTNISLLLITLWFYYYHNIGPKALCKVKKNSKNPKKIG